jgi:hypothetical protein
VIRPNPRTPASPGFFSDSIPQKHLKLKITIANPRCGGAKHTSQRRAEIFVRRGIARWLPDGRIEFLPQSRLRFEAAEMRQTLREEAIQFAQNRGGVVYWNGARSVYLRGTDIAMYKPGSNVLFPKPGTQHAARYYQRRTLQE